MFVPVLVINNEFRKSFAKYGIIMLVNSKRSMRETAVRVRVIDSSTCTSRTTIAAKSQIRT